MDFSLHDSKAEGRWRHAILRTLCGRRELAGMAFALPSLLASPSHHPLTRLPKVVQVHIVPTTRSHKQAVPLF